MPAMTPLRIVRDAFTEDPALDTAVSRALLLRASDGEIPETFRLHVPGRVVAFGKRDTLEPGYPAAVAVTRQNGFAPIERLAGGRAAVFTRHTLAFAWTIPDPDPRRGIYDRFRRLSALMVGAFGRLGVASDVGEIPGEYCPGDYSVHHAGRIKLMGVGQRLARRAAHVGGVVVVDRSEDVRNILVDVYAALGLHWEPETAGALTDVHPGITLQAAADAVLEELAGHRTIVPDEISTATVDLAHRLADDHVPKV
jgi:octanoyl-[GcvH]:protein N-octanoyltransferase